MAGNRSKDRILNIFYLQGSYPVLRNSDRTLKQKSILGCTHEGAWGTSKKTCCCQRVALLQASRTATCIDFRGGLQSFDVPLIQPKCSQCCWHSLVHTIAANYLFRPLLQPTGLRVSCYLCVRTCDATCVHMFATAVDGSDGDAAGTLHVYERGC